MGFNSGFKGLINFLHFMQTERSQPFSQDRASTPNSQPVQSNRHRPIYFSTILTSMLLPFWICSTTKFPMRVTSLIHTPLLPDLIQIISAWVQIRLYENPTSGRRHHCIKLQSLMIPLKVGMYPLTIRWVHLRCSVLIQT